MGVDGYTTASRKTLQYIKFFFIPQLIQILSKILHISAYCRLSYYTNKTLGWDVSSWPKPSECLGNIWAMHLCKYLCNYSLDEAVEAVYLLGVLFSYLLLFLLSVIDCSQLENPMFCKFLLCIINDLKHRRITIRKRLKISCDKLHNQDYLHLWQRDVTGVSCNNSQGKKLLQQSKLPSHSKVCLVWSW